MTSKRDLKRRVRERQARTSESYVTALRQVKAQKPSPVPFLELTDLTEVAARLGLKCRVSCLPAVGERVDTTALLEKLRDALLATERDPAMAPIRAAVLRGERPATTLSDRLGARLLDETARFLARARAGIGGVSANGRMLAMSVKAKRGTETVLFLLRLEAAIAGVTRQPTLIITALDALYVDPVLEWVDKR